MIGIYKITNNINNKIYIGCSVDIERRWKEHLNDFLGQKQENKLLYKAFKEEGIENFSFEIIQECKVDELYEKEKYWIKFYNSCYLWENSNGYNMTSGGNGAIGEENRRAVLTEEDVYFIRNSYASQKPKIEIYRKYFQNKISFSGFDAVWNGRNWKHIMPEIYTEEEKQKHIHRSLKGRVNVGQNNSKSKLTDEQVKNIIYLLEHSKKSQTQIAKDFGVSYNTINGINRCLNWTHLHQYKNNIREEYNKKAVVMPNDYEE